MTAEQLFLDHLPLIERIAIGVCRRRHLRFDEIEEFLALVKLRLLEDDYAVLRKFEGKSELATFLTTVITRLFFDQLDRRLGKFRPCAEAKRLGPTAEALDRLLHRDSLALEDACRALWAGGARESAETFKSWAARFPQRHPRRFESDEPLREMASDEPDAAARLLSGEAAFARARVLATLNEAIAKEADQDRLILELWKDGWGVARIARRLGLEQRALYRRLERLWKRLRARLEAEGIDRDLISEILRLDEIPEEGSGRSAPLSV
ncbi:MAG TPA: sigma-70 family RNA polymerase sigma factor [Thermoanaerobaculia bacterium]|nr:sigma-70 family RNA polymerase sigma factor [Thermoanaerobaculia bacterium]